MAGEPKLSFWRIRWDYVSCAAVYDEGRVNDIDDFFEGRVECAALKLAFDPADDRPKCDFPTYIPGLIFARDRAMRSLSGELESSCHKCLVRIDEVEFGVFACHIVLDGFDYERSEFDLFGDGGAVKRLRRIVLRPKFSTSHDVFRLAGENAISRQLIVSKSFKQKYEDLGYTGLKFQEVYQ